MAKQLKHQFVKQPITRNGLIWVGQTSHAVTTRMTIWSSGYKVRSIAPLEEEQALSRGADLLSESFIFSVSVGIVVFEYNRSSEKAEKKEAARLQKIRDNASRLQAKLDSLDKRLVALEEYAKANRRSILSSVGIGGANNGQYIEPKDIVPINDGMFDEEHSTPLKDEENATNNNKLPPVENTPATQQKSWRRFWPF